MTKAQQVLKMREENPQVTAAEIARKLKVKRSYVYSVFYLDKRKKRVKEIKEAKAVPMKGEIKLMPTISREAELRKEIEELTIIIAYLEHRVKMAEGYRGSPI